MLVTLAALLLGLAVIALILGLIQPKWVLIGNGHKTRAKVLLIYSLVFVIGIILNVIALPSSFEAGKKALSDKNYEYAIIKLESIPSDDKHYNEAQALLKQARLLLWPSKLEAAKKANTEHQYAQVIQLLNDYPKKEEGYTEASQLIAVANAELEEQQKQKNAEAAAKEADAAYAKAEEERKKALSDYPECDSKNATEAVTSALADAPLGRVHGYALIKIKNAAELSASPAERKCQGIAFMNDGNSYPIMFSFARDGEDIMVQAQVIGL